MNDVFALVRKKKEYVQTNANPKISVDQSTYRLLQDAAVETGLSISAIAKQAVEFAFERLQYVEE